MAFGFGFSNGGSRVIVGPTPGTFLRAANTSRVDILMIGDSNQLLSGHGWDHGLHKACHDRWGLYATGYMPANTNSGSGSGQGYFYGSINPGAASPHGQVTGAPTFFADRWAWTNGFQYAYFRNGEADTFGGNNGMQMIKGGPWDMRGDFRGHFCYGAFETAGGGFTAGVRWEESPYWPLASDVAASASDASDQIKIATIDVDADAERSNLNIGFRWYRAGAANVSGEMFALYQRVEVPSRTSGVAVHTMHGVGGQSLYDMAAEFIALPDETIMQALLESRRLQGETKRTIIWVNSGLNDRGETQTSLGPLGSTDGDSADAYADNLHALVTRIESCWLKSGYPLSELAWVVMPSHPVDDPDDSELVAYRTAAAAYCEQAGRFKFIDLAALTNEAEMLANSWYASGGADRAHLASATAYEVLAGRALAEALRD